MTPKEAVLLHRPRARIQCFTVPPRGRGSHGVRFVVVQESPPFHQWQRLGGACLTEEAAWQSALKRLEKEKT